MYEKDIIHGTYYENKLEEYKLKLGHFIKTKESYDTDRHEI